MIPEEIRDKIDEAASTLILLDMSSEEDIRDFQKTLEDIQKGVDGSEWDVLARVIQAFQETRSSLGEDQEVLRKAFNHVVRFLQSMADQDMTALNPDETLSRFQTELKQLTGSPGDEPSGPEVPAPSTLTETQRAMLPDFIHDTQVLLDEIESDLLHVEENVDGEEDLGPLINKIFRAFHTIKGEANLLGVVVFGRLAHTAEDLLEKLRSRVLSVDTDITYILLKTVDTLKRFLVAAREDKVEGAIADLEMFHKIARDLIQNKLNTRLKKEVGGKEKGKTVKKTKPVGEILIAEGLITRGELENALHIQKTKHKEKRIGEILQQTRAIKPKDIERALKIQKGVEESVIKIRVEKLDALIELVGELVISETQVAQNEIIKRIDNQGLVKDMAQLDRITRRLQEITMGMRLVSIKPVFQKMLRIIRDLTRKSKKDVNVVLSGEDTEIDKKMIELISDPLVHMVRNSVDHGIETKEERQRLGKDVIGHIWLSAFHKGGNVIVEIRDDGAGLDKEKIFQKAVEKGIVAEDSQLSDDKIYHLIFEPGFSTAETVTDISGRGVGMDVVKRNIEQMRGRVDIASKKGEGTTFSIQLPLTLAIIEGIVLKVGSRRYILPVTSVVEFVQPRKEMVTSVAGQGEVYRVYGKIYPLVRLRTYFQFEESTRPLEESVVCLVESDVGRVCLVADSLVGQQQVVIKSLGEALKKVKGISGGAILGDGRVGLILDVNGIVEIVRQDRALI